MKVFKFGGASVRDAAGIRNVATILRRFSSENLAVVVSAMGKTTNALEDLTRAYAKGKGDKDAILAKIHEDHIKEMDDLFENNRNHPVYAAVAEVFSGIQKRFDVTASANYDLVYDQIVSQGEFISSVIVSHYMNAQGIENTWYDARTIIRTDSTFREGKVDWDASQKLANQHLIPFYIGSVGRKIAITQGFLGSTSIGLTTTLGREGSDYTAAILAYLLDAKDVTIWKDVAGVMNADPRKYDKAVKFDRISFREAIELSYYGASVIHPKTIKPLQNKGIPLYVKSFLQPEEKGTIIQASEEYDHLIPSFIFKSNQVLISVLPRDFSFIVEENLREIFDVFASLGVRVHLMQNSALSFSVCIDHNEDKFPDLLKRLQENYKVKYNETVELITIRHYDQATIDMLTNAKEILVEQKSRHTARFIVRPKL
ncbi:MAG TPA: aspartate kinase [Flavobacteriales bacterium]|nr:aspartate kinase [Flavobacteriales bacterium]HRJ37792.1 aspartate kinase [Flavobacteriales bacterium]